MAQDARNILRHLSLMYSSHTTCGAQCSQCRCEYAHHHLNNCFPSIFFHKLLIFNCENIEKHENIENLFYLNKNLKNILYTVRCADSTSVVRFVCLLVSKLPDSQPSPHNRPKAYELLKANNPGLSSTPTSKTKFCN